MKSTQKYSVFYSGELLPGFDLKKSIPLLYTDLGLSKDEIRRILTSNTKIIKNNVSFETAKEYTKKFLNCGLYCFYSPDEMDDIDLFVEQVSVQPQQTRSTSPMVQSVISRGQDALKNSFGTSIEYNQDLLYRLTGDIKSGEVAELLSIHLQKMDKVPHFLKSLRMLVINGRFQFAATWNWSAFFFTWSYLLYRKLYLPGVVAFASSLFLSFTIPFLVIFIDIGCGIAADYLYSKKFITDMQTSGYPDNDPRDIKNNLQMLGGYNSWAIIAFVVYSILVIIISVAIGSMALLMFSY